jgi:hypothetical protein
MAHLMRLEYIKAKAYRSKPKGGEEDVREDEEANDDVSPWDGMKIPMKFRNRRAGLIVLALRDQATVFDLN